MSGETPRTEAGRGLLGAVERQFIGSEARPFVWLRVVKAAILAIESEAAALASVPAQTGTGDREPLRNLGTARENAAKAGVTLRHTDTLRQVAQRIVDDSHPIRDAGIPRGWQEDLRAALATGTGNEIDVERVRGALRFTDWSGDSDRAVATFMRAYRDAGAS